MTDDQSPQNSETSQVSIPHADASSLRQYWMFFSGQLLSLFGSSVVQFAIIWWLTITASQDFPGKEATILALASIAGFAPFVLTSLFAGVLVDRWNRKWVLGVADFVQAAVTGVLLVTFWLGYASIPVVLVILAIRAIAQGFHSPATQAIIPLMVPREQYQIVTSYNYLFNSAIFLVGPMVGAVLVEWVGVDNLATILWVDMISFLMAVIPLALITIPDITKEKREAKEKTSFRQEFREGISFIVKAKGLLPLLLTFTLINILVTPVMMLMPLVAVADNLLAGTATTLAIIMISNQGGTFSGSFLLTRFKPFRQNVRGVAIGQFAIYLGVLGMAVGAMLGNLWIVAAFAFVDGLGMPIANIHSQNVWLSVVPPELQGRVMSVRQAIAWIMIPVAQFAGGILADRFGILTVYYGGAAIGLVALTLAWYLTSFPRVEAILGLDVEPVVPSIEMAEPVVTTDT